MSDNVTLTSNFPQITSLISMPGEVRCYVKQTQKNKQTDVWNNEVDVLDIFKRFK